MGLFLPSAVTLLFAHFTVALIQKSGNLVVTNAVVNPVGKISRHLKSLSLTDNDLRTALSERP